MSGESIEIVRMNLMNDISESVRVVHEILKALVWAELGLNTDRVQPPRDLVGDPGEDHGDQGHSDIGPDRLPAQTPHPRVQVREEGGVDILLRDQDSPPDQVHRGELHQRGDGRQAVPENPGLSGGVECVVAEL